MCLSRHKKRSDTHFFMSLSRHKKMDQVRIELTTFACHMYRLFYKHDALTN